MRDRQARTFAYPKLLGSEQQRACLLVLKWVAFKGDRAKLPRDNHYWYIAEFGDAKFFTPPRFLATTLIQ